MLRALDANRSNPRGKLGEIQQPSTVTNAWISSAESGVDKERDGSWENIGPR